MSDDGRHTFYHITGNSPRAALEGNSDDFQTALAAAQFAEVVQKSDGSYKLFDRSEKKSSGSSRSKPRASKSNSRRKLFTLRGPSRSGCYHFAETPDIEEGEAWLSDTRKYSSSSLSNAAGTQAAERLFALTQSTPDFLQHISSSVPPSDSTTQLKMDDAADLIVFD